MKLIQQLLQSKKFIAMLVGVVGLVILKVFGVQVDPATVAEIVGLIAAYVIGQGISDSGKEAAKIAAVASVANLDKSPDADKAMVTLAKELK